MPPDQVPTGMPISVPGRLIRSYWIAVVVAANALIICETADDGRKRDIAFCGPRQAESSARGHPCAQHFVQCRCPQSHRGCKRLPSITNGSLSVTPEAADLIEAKHVVQCRPGGHRSR